MVIIAIILIQQSQSIVTPTATSTTSSTASPTSPPTHRDLWNTRGGQNYEMIVEWMALPAPPVAQALTIQDRKIVKSSLVACDNPSEEYPAWACEPVKAYYAAYGLYTIEDLFSNADFSLHRTREAMSRCHAVGISTFRDFPNADAMFDAAKTCEADLVSKQIDAQTITISTLSAVEYDSYYGYPEKISSTTVGALDSTSFITVKDFRLTE